MCAVTLVLVLLGVCSEYVGVLVRYARIDPTSRVQILRGVITIDVIDPSTPMRRRQPRNTDHVQFGHIVPDSPGARVWLPEKRTPPEQIRPIGYSTRVVIPIWTTAAVPCFLWLALHAQSRHRKGCAKCGYPRDGLPQGAPCPECGETPAAPQGVPRQNNPLMRRALPLKQRALRGLGSMTMGLAILLAMAAAVSEVYPLCRRMRDYDAGSRHMLSGGVLHLQFLSADALTLLRYKVPYIGRTITLTAGASDVVGSRVLPA